MAEFDGILWGTQWSSTDLTFSFPTSASYYGSPYGSGQPADNFEALNATQRAATRKILGTIEDVTNLDFTEITETATNHAVLRYAMSDTPATATGYYPADTEAAGDVWFNNSSGNYDNPLRGSYAYATIIHETGHALGLKHGHEAGTFGTTPLARDSIEYSVMSYRSYIGASVAGGYTVLPGSYPQTLMMDDIAALQHMYGADFTTNGGNTVYRWNPTTGQISINGIGQQAPMANKVLMTVWDGGGVDTYDFSNYTSNLAVDLRPGLWSKTSTAQLADLGDGHTAIGNIANALQYNGDARSLIENANGGSGSDTIYGNQAGNSLVGNAGDDYLWGIGGNDVLRGGAGKDSINGDAGNDTVDFRDKTTAVELTLNGANWASAKVGGVHEDWVITVENIWGGTAADKLTGDGLGNYIWGNAGDDIINGSGGNDILLGAVGRDTFVFNTALSAAGNVDRLDDFNVADDTIWLENAVFGALTTTGALATGAFWSGAAAHDATDRIIYNASNGVLLYDADGTGSAAAVKFAQLAVGLGLTSADFIVV